MPKQKKWRMAVRDISDGSGDGLLELPPNLLAHLGLAVGDALKLKIEDGVTTLAPIARKAKKARQEKRGKASMPLADLARGATPNG